MADPHCGKHLSDDQAELFDEEDLIRTLRHDRPKQVGLQANGNYAVLYRKKRSHLKIILSVEKQYLQIITFLYPLILPATRRKKRIE